MTISDQKIIIAPHEWTRIPGLPIEVWSTADSNVFVMFLGADRGEVILGGIPSWRVRCVTLNVDPAIGMYER